MGFHRRALVSLLLLSGPSVNVHAEVLVRWDFKQVPSPSSLGISTLVVPAASTEALQSALGQGYRVYLEVEASRLATFTPPARGLAGVVVKGKTSPTALAQLRQRLPRGVPVIVLEERGKWPHIRSNWVTKNNEVLQVAGRSAQPWIENNAALLRIVHATQRGSPPTLTYAWQPITLSEIDEGPALENYLVAIAEAGSFGGDLVLPLHERFQKRLLLGLPQARSEWSEIRRYIEFYSWALPTRYEPIANIGVVTDNPTLWFEVMNLLSRHNLPFELIAPAELNGRALGGFKVLIVFDTFQRAGVLADFEKNGGKVQRVTAVADPNVFALQIRQLLGREQRVIDIWNGITVLTAPYKEPRGTTVLVTVLNYAYQPLPVQLRVQGTFSTVHYESPEEPATLLPHQHRDGYTEFVLPALRIGGRVFLSGKRPK